MSRVHTCSEGCKEPGCSRRFRDEIARLKAYNDRLIEAGNGVFWYLTKFTDADNANRACKAWIAARDGNATK